MAFVCDDVFTVVDGTNGRPLGDGTDMGLTTTFFAGDRLRNGFSAAGDATLGAGLGNGFCGAGGRATTEAATGGAVVLIRVEVFVERSVAVSVLVVAVVLLVVFGAAGDDDFGAGRDTCVRDGFVTGILATGGFATRSLAISAFFFVGCVTGLP